MVKYTLEEIMYVDKYSIESAVVTEVFKMVQQGMPAKEIKEQLNMIYGHSSMQQNIGFQFINIGKIIILVQHWQYLSGVL